MFLTIFFRQSAGTISMLCLFGNTCHPQHFASLDYKSFCFVLFCSPCAPFWEDTEKQHKKSEIAVLKLSD